MASDDDPLTTGILRCELNLHFARTLQIANQNTADMLREQLLPRDCFATNMASKLNVHGQALMELTSAMSELNSNKGATQLKDRVDRLEKQIVEYSFLLEGLERDDSCPLELPVVKLIQDEFRFSIEPRDVDLAVRFGSTNKKPRAVLVTLVCRWMKRSIPASRKILAGSNYKVRDFLPEEVLDILVAANTEKLVDNVESCWPARGRVYVKTDEKAKPQYVANIRQFHALISHTVALRGTASVSLSEQTPARPDEQMDTLESEVPPKTPSATATQVQAQNASKNNNVPPSSTTNDTVGKTSPFAVSI